MENCIHAEQTDIPGLVVCQIDGHSKDDDMICEKHEPKEREWNVEEVIEELRNWKLMFNSESETKWLMNKAADYLEQLKDKT